MSKRFFTLTVKEAGKEEVVLNANDVRDFAAYFRVKEDTVNEGIVNMLIKELKDTICRCKDITGLIPSGLTLTETVGSITQELKLNVSK